MEDRHENITSPSNWMTTTGHPHKGLHNHWKPTAIAIWFVAAVLCSAPGSSDAQLVRKGGFLGLGKKDDQVSGALFPQGRTQEPVSEDQILQEAVNNATAAGRSDDPPKKKKRGSLFSFGKRSAQPSPEPSIEPIPAPVTAQTSANQTTAAASSYNEGAAAMSTATNSAMSPAPAISPEPQEKKRGFSLFGGRNKKNSDTTEELKQIANSAVYQDLGGGDTATANAAAAPSMAAPTTEAGGPATSAPALQNSGEYVVQAPPPPPMAAAEPEKKRRFGFPSLPKPSLPKIKKQASKPTNYTGMEAVIKDGVFIENSSPQITSTSPPPAPTGTRGAPRAPTIVNGVKTYSSWDDVESRSVSAADKIISRMR